MNRTIEQWVALADAECKFHIVLNEAISDLQELARQRDELLGALELCRYDSLNMSIADMEKVREIYRRIKEQTK